MQSRFTQFVCIAALVTPALTIPAAAQAQMTQTANGYLFRLQSTAGKKLDFLMQTSHHMAMPNMPGMPANMRNMSNMSLSSPIHEVITAVHGDVLTLSMTSGPAQMNGRPMGKARTIVMKMKNDGEIIGSSASGMQNMSFGDLFAHPIQIGHTYVIPFSIKGAPGSPFSMTGSDKIKFVGFKQYNGIRTAQFDVIFSGSSSFSAGHPGSGTAHMQGTGVQLISVADGWPERFKMTTTQTMGNMGGKARGMPSMKTTMIITMTRK